MLTKIKNHLFIWWLCIRYVLTKFKMPPSSLRNWMKNAASDKDVEEAHKRINENTNRS